MINISTHALTWSATLSLFLFIRFLAISTHALTWSATLLSYALTPTNEFQLTHSRGVRRFSLSNFNSRTHVECDYDCIDCHVEYYNISTHALTWSATRRVCCNVEQTKFQLTHSRGVRPGLIDVCPGCKNFNSRTHVECDLGYITSKDLLDNFNSRTHVECDADEKTCCGWF